MIWSYGITTVPVRRYHLLPQTIASLRGGGFPEPRLFVDGDNDPKSWEAQFGLKVTCQDPPLLVVGNWIVTLWSLYIRYPQADRYAVFQDDFIMSKNVREYLERVPYPNQGYLNLYTFLSNQRVCPKDKDGRDKIGFYKAAYCDDTPPWQTGKGAVALVFSRDAVHTLLSARSLVCKPSAAKKPTKAIDGGIVTAMNNAGWCEYVHNPSLVQHTGKDSTIGNNEHRKASSFRGEDFNALDLLK
jgi:hypothetical protein